MQRKGVAALRTVCNPPDIEKMGKQKFDLQKKIFNFETEKCHSENLDNKKKFSRLFGAANSKKVLMKNLIYKKKKKKFVCPSLLDKKLLHLLGGVNVSLIFTGDEYFFKKNQLLK